MIRQERKTVGVFKAVAPDPPVISAPLKVSPVAQTMMKCVSERVTKKKDEHWA